MNLGYLQDSIDGERRPATRREISQRISQYRAWKTLVNSRCPDNYTIEIEHSGDGGWQTALYLDGRVIARQCLWYPSQNATLSQAW